jgi:hypothetical protein
MVLSVVKWFGPIDDLERINNMSTSKKVAAPAAIEAAAEFVPVVRYGIGALELSVAADAAQADAASVESAVAIFDLIFGDFPKGHGVTLRDLRKLETGERRDNQETSAWHFVRRFHAIRRCGLEIADKLADANVKGDAILQKAGVNPMTMAAYKPQTKRQIIQSIYNTDDWGRFLGKMAEVAAARDRKAKITAQMDALIEAGADDAVIEAAGKAAEIAADAEATKKRGASRRPLNDRVRDKVNEVIKSLRQDPEKMDASIDLETAKKFAAYLVDGLKIYGIK